MGYHFPYLHTHSRDQVYTLEVLRLTEIQTHQVQSALCSEPALALCRCPHPSPWNLSMLALGHHRARQSLSEEEASEKTPHC